MDLSLEQQKLAWSEADQLIGILRAWGISYLVGEDDADYKREQIAPVDLIKRLAQCIYPRVRDASITLFLLHPELADAVLEAVHTSATPVADQIVTLALATLYLQRHWSIRLAIALGRLSSFPEAPFAAFWLSHLLPAPACRYGKWGLKELVLFEQQRNGFPFNYEADWQNQIDHLLWQEESQRRPVIVFPQKVFEEEMCDQEDVAMSMRLNVDKGQIENFLKNLGRTFHKPGRLYLVGGAALVHMGVRAGNTQDIDVDVHAANEDEMLETIRKLKETMNINVELSSPADFIPVPSQWESNARYIGRYGMIDVFYFDFYSIALSKIQRGSTRDITDVRLLLRQGIITLSQLDAVYSEVLPFVGKKPYSKLDPKQFIAHYTSVHQLLEQG